MKALFQPTWPHWNGLARAWLLGTAAALAAAGLSLAAPAAPAPQPRDLVAGDTLELGQYVRMPNLALAPFDEYVSGPQSAGTMTLRPTLRTPTLPLLHRGAAPVESANINLADLLYVDLSLGLDLTFTDNVFRDDSRRKSDLIARGVLGLTITLQLADNFGLQVAGNLVYYQALGESSVSGYGFREAFVFENIFEVDPGLTGNGLFGAQVEWHETVGLLDFRAGDRFTVTERVMDNPFVGDTIQTATEIQNRIFAGSGCLFPAQLRADLDYTHDDFWYNRRFDDYGRTEDALAAALRSERETMRFQPRLGYTVRRIKYRTDDRLGTTHEGTIGVRAPVTDNMNLDTGLGYNRTDDNNSEWLWLFSLDHLMNARTRHKLVWKRKMTPASDALQATRTDLDYLIGHNLMLDMTIWLGLTRSFYDTSGQDEASDSWRFHARLTRELARYTKVTLEYAYINWDSDGPGQKFSENRATLNLRWDP